MRSQSADFIGARSAKACCAKAGYRVAIHPVGQNRQVLAQGGGAHIELVEAPHPASTSSARTGVRDQPIRFRGASRQRGRCNHLSRKRAREKDQQRTAGLASLHPHCKIESCQCLPSNDFRYETCLNRCAAGAASYFICTFPKTRMRLHHESVCIHFLPHRQQAA